MGARAVPGSQPRFRNKVGKGHMVYYLEGRTSTLGVINSEKLLLLLEFFSRIGRS
jgi:hypothetical protein